MNGYAVPPLMSLLFFAGLGVLALKKGPANKQNRLFTVLCFLGVLLNADIFLIFLVESERTALWISRIDHLFVVYTIPVYIHFFHEYLGVVKRKQLVRWAYGYATGLMLLAPTPLCLSAMQRFPFGYFARGGALYPLVGGGAFFAVGYSLFLLYRAIAGEQRSAVQRNRLRYMLVGFGGMGVLNGLNVLPLMGAAVYPAGTFSFIPLTVFAFGLFRYDLLNLDILIRGALLYLSLALVLAFSYASTLLLGQAFFPGDPGAFPMGLSLLFFLVAAASFGPLKKCLRSLIDTTFSPRQNRDRVALQSLSRAIASVLDMAEIFHHLDRTIQTSLQPVRFCAAFRSAESGGLIEYPPENPGPIPVSRDAGASVLARHFQAHAGPLERSRLLDLRSDRRAAELLQAMAQLQAEVVFPLRFQERFNGFLALGESRNGELYTPEDMGLLETLASQTALAVENANAYQKIEKMNEGLEAAVRLRTCALETALSEKDRAQESLVRSESLAAIGQLVAGAAHELNNPLTSAISLLQSAVEEMRAEPVPTTVDAEMIEDLQFANGELQRARDIVASLLDLSRQTQTYNEPVDLSAAVRHALRIVKTQFKRSCVEVKEHYEKDLPSVPGNFANIGQAVINLIKNAFQAVAEENGTVYLSTRMDADAGVVAFECRDTGGGIPGHVRKDLFKPFFTTKPVGQGTGLGLYVTHEIVKKHGGDIIVAPGPDRGAVFTLELPLPEAP